MGNGSTQKNQGIIGTINGWFQHPFQSGGNAFNWVLFVGLIIIAVFLWNVILIELTREVQRV